MTQKQRKLVRLTACAALLCGVVPTAGAMHIMEGFLPPSMCILWGVIALPNDASCQLHESMGFRKMGVQHQSGFKMGRWIDVVYYEKALSDHPLPAPPLHAFSDLDAASVQQILDRWGNLS